MNKHTPGPWTIDPRPHTSINKGNKHIAMVNYFNAGDKDERTITNEEHNANAHLIATAPELLEACEAALEEFNGILITLKMVDSTGTGVYPDPNVISSLEVIIRKAKGE